MHVVAATISTAGQILDDAVVTLRAAGCPTPVWDAAVLVADAVGADLDDLDLHLTRPLAATAVQDGVARRAAREPLAYIRGHCRFRGLRLSVDERVLVPWEPYTGLLVDVGLEQPSGARVHEVGTGAGAVSLALKHERPDLRISASDISADAVDVARANAAALDSTCR